MKERLIVYHLFKEEIKETYIYFLWKVQDLSSERARERETEYISN